MMSGVWTVTELLARHHRSHSQAPAAMLSRRGPRRTPHDGA
eukprot:CAMPEP_0206026378 /NCGR_PEP_ID=MMETSP1464-20131121/41559_1 /ASSEMBLY_ACC=CAM_ASM_001124 /TAXON_ID=119497 /ORGANISM="Exanthemachrysis gayraliae, Strain RCC1523" /LENGTH=40 /DNA_ID= /DNA_START= /DNA_END= /DNA_ORIENTATION=